MLDYLRYYDEAASIVICYWCMHRMTYMQFNRTPCVDIIAIALLGGGAITHALAPFYGWRLDRFYGDPMLWTGLIAWCVVPSLRKWADRRHHRLILGVLSKKAW